MKPSKFFLAATLALLICGSPPLAVAQPDKDNPGQLAKGADDEWQALKELGRGASSKADLLRDADRLKEFRDKHPTHAQAKEAKRLEALVLVYAWQAGESAHETRRKQLVAEVRQDTSIPSAKRAEVAALADHVAVGKQRHTQRAEVLLAYEAVVRRLIAEFPDQPNGYEALMSLAKDSPNAKAQALAREVLELPSPHHVKLQAQTLLNRFELVGDSLAELTRPVLGSDSPIVRAKGQPILIYSWATYAPGSLHVGKELAEKVPPGYAIFGVCLDGDLVVAKQRAATEKLAGQHFYDATGPHGTLAGRLELDAPGLLYVTDREGIVRTVAAPHAIEATLAALTTPQPQ